MDLEKISLEFTASAGNASKTFDALEKRLSRLQTALDRIDTSGLDRMAQHFEKLNSTLSSFKANTDVGKSLSTVATAMNRFATVDTAAVARANSVLASMTGTLNSLPMVDATKTASLANLATSLNAFGRVRSVNGISGLSNLGKNISQLMISLDGFDPALLQSVSDSLLKLANSLNILGKANVGKAITVLPQLTQQIGILMQSLARAPTVSQNTIAMTQALAQLASQGSKVGTATSGLNRALNNTSTAGRNGARGLQIFGNTAKAQRRHIKSLASVIGGLIAKYWVLWRGIQMLGNMAGIASNLVEVQNVVDHTFGQMQYKLDEFTQDSIDKFGLSTLQAKQYASRFQSMGMAMGITNQQVANSADFVSSHLSEQSKELYNAGDSLADMSINLTKLSADYASFYDVDPAESFEKFQSVLTGQARPLRAYGLDLTQATVQEWALKNGIEANMSAMSQAEKAMLRYQYVMAQSSHITSDFARTSDRKCVA